MLNERSRIQKTTLHTLIYIKMFKRQTVDTESRWMMATGWMIGMTEKGHERTLWDDGNSLYNHCGRYTLNEFVKNHYIVQSVVNLCKLHLNEHWPPPKKKKETLGKMPIITHPSHIHYASWHEWGVILDGGNSGEETDEKKDDHEEKRQRRDVLDQASRSFHSRGWQLGCSGQSWGRRARLPTRTRKGALHPWGSLHVSVTSSIEPSLALCAWHLSLSNPPSTFLQRCHVLEFLWRSGLLLQGRQHLSPANTYT